MTADQALILFDLLSRWLDGELLMTDSAECAVLNRMLAELERQLVSPFSADYALLVAKARERLIAQG